MKRIPKSFAILFLLLLWTAMAMPQSVSVKGWNVTFDTISPVIITSSTQSAPGLDADQITVKDTDDPSKVATISIGHYTSSRMATPETMQNTATSALPLAFPSQLGIEESTITSRPYTIDGKEGVIASAYAKSIKRNVYLALYPLDLKRQEASWMVSIVSFFDEASTNHILDNLRMNRIN